MYRITRIIYSIKILLLIKINGLIIIQIIYKMLMRLIWEWKIMITKRIKLEKNNFLLFNKIKSNLIMLIIIKIIENKLYSNSIKEKILWLIYELNIFYKIVFN